MAYTFTSDVAELHDWIRAELAPPPAPVVRGHKDAQVRRVQEWLCLHGIRLVVDADFGPATQRGVERFQKEGNLAVSGEVDRDTFDRLVAPMREVCRRRPDAGSTMTAATLAYAAAHLKPHPREVGGANKGPWVRLYMKGGVDPWCAGFVTFAMRQAAESLGQPPPITGSFGCDALAAQAKAAGRFLSEADARPDRLPPGSVFLVRKTATDWTHTGIVAQALPGSFDTIEGNTDDAGGREGVEACARTRGYAKKDFILL